MTTQRPSEYIRNMDKRKYTLTRITPQGKLVYVLNGVEFEKHEFYQYFPIADKIRVLHPAQQKGRDVDPTHF